MNLYLVIAIALGAITGVAGAPPAARPAVSVSRRDSRGERRIVRQGTRVLSSQFSVLRFVRLRTENRELRTLRGDAAARAPSVA